MNLQEYLIKNFDVDIGDGIPVPLTTRDGGPGWESLVAYKESDDTPAGIALTPAPSDGKRIVLDDLILSTKTANDVLVKSPVGGGISTFYMGDTATIQMTPRGKIALPSGDRLVVKGSAAGKVAATAVYHEEPTAEPSPYGGYHSLSFDGVDDNVFMGTAAALSAASVGDMTLDIYFFVPEDFSGGAQLFAYGNSETEYFEAIFVRAAFPDSVQVDVYVGTSIHNEVKLPFAGGWYYLRIRRTGGYVHLYLNGVEALGLIQEVSFVAPTGNFSLGYYNYDADPHSYMRGNICYMQAWAVDMGALSTIPTSPFPNDENTVLRLAFDEGAGDMLFDSSDNDLNGLILGATWSEDLPLGWGES